MAGIDFGEIRNSHETLNRLKAQASKTHDSNIINDKNAELLKKLDESKHELCLLMLEVATKFEEVYCLDYTKLLRSELERMQAVEKAP